MSETLTIQQHCPTGRLHAGGSRVNLRQKNAMEIRTNGVAVGLFKTDKEIQHFDLPCRVRMVSIGLEDSKPKQSTKTNLTTTNASF